MIISHQQLLAAMQQRVERVSGADLQGVSPASSSRALDAGSKADGIQLSPRAQEVLELRRALNDLPDIRSERVDSIRAKREAGTYDVSAEDVAEKIMSRIVIDEIFHDGESEAQVGEDPS